MFSSDIELPVKCTPYPDESGYGFCIRAICRNGANLYALRRAINLPEVQEFHKSHAFALAGIFGVSSQWLSSTLKDNRHSKIRPQEFWGHTIYLPTHLRWATPQVCPLCVHRYGYCKAIWDVALSTVCLEHRCLLIDSCKQCGQALRWNRPSVDVGHCKHYIQAVESNMDIPDDTLDLQMFLEKKFTAESGALIESQRSEALAPQLLRASSFGAALIYLTAFGARGQLFDKTFSEVTRQRLSTSRWRELGVRGWQRCQSFDLSSSDKYIEADLVLSKLISRILVPDAQPDDAQLAASTLHRLNVGDLSADLTRNAPFLRQQVLFK